MATTMTASRATNRTAAITAGAMILLSLLPEELGGLVLPPWLAPAIKKTELPIFSIYKLTSHCIRICYL